MIEKRRWLTALAAAGALACASATAQEAEQRAEEAWQESEQTAEEAWQESEQTAKEAWQESEQTAKEAWQESEQTAEQTAQETEREAEQTAQQMEQEPGQTDQMNQDLQQLAEEHQDLATFIKAVNEAGMAEALTQSGEQYTIFAPTDEAFESADRSVEELLQPENREELISLLRAHIVADDMDPEMAERIGQARTIDGGTVDLQGSGEELQVGDAQVVQSDIQQGNLRIYAIDQVLSPSPGAGLAAADEQQGASGETAQAGNFDDLDSDGDGYLSEEELQAAEQQLSQSELDTDNDGRVSRTEFAAFEGSEQESGAMEDEQQDDGGWFSGDDDQEPESDY